MQYAASGLLEAVTGILQARAVCVRCRPASVAARWRRTSADMRPETPIHRHLGTHGASIALLARHRHRQGALPQTRNASFLKRPPPTKPFARAIKPPGADLTGSMDPRRRLPPPFPMLANPRPLMASSCRCDTRILIVARFSS